MHRMVISCPLFLAMAALGGGSAAAEPAAHDRFEVGGMGGGHVFADDIELGVVDSMDASSPDSSLLLGARVGYWPTARIGVESELVAIPTEDRQLGEEAWVLGLRAHGRVDVLTGRFRPFVVAGVGFLEIIPSADAVTMEDDTDLSLHWGGGLQVRLTRQLDLRVDARHLIVPNVDDRGGTSDFELATGLSYRFGGRAPRPAPAPALAREPAPRDGDADGIVDADDRCPNEPEDRDRFEDADGCPDADNDGDGIADASDRCPFEAETINQYEDADGCPDEVIVELTGIGFDLGSDRISEDSAPLLEKVVAVLRTYPDLRLEIAGHTSSEGGRARNLELSRLRARAVRAYLVRAGIAGDRLRAVGYGADRPVASNETPEGRAENRRIEFRVLTE